MERDIGNVEGHLDEPLLIEELDRAHRLELVASELAA